MTFAPRTLRVTLLALASLFGCNGSTPINEAVRKTVAVRVQPHTAKVATGGAVSFGALVTGTANTMVTWSVQEGAGGGSVTSAGLYTAPATGGTFHVVATSQADATKSDTATVTVSLVAVAISPKTATVAEGGTQTFTASVTGTTNTAVTYSVQETSGCGSITTAGVYTAPAAAGNCHVAATSVADATSSDTAAVSVTAPSPTVAVAITPPTAATNSCQSFTFAATVTGTTNTAVTWSVQEGSAGGAVTTSGVYTAPSSAGTYHVVATSQADPTKTAVATVTVTDKILSVAIAPSSTSVAAGGTVQFTANVTTTCGTFTSTLAVGAVN